MCSSKFTSGNAVRKRYLAKLRNVKQNYKCSFAQADASDNKVVGTGNSINSAAVATESESDGVEF
jgi:hypothetical protein